MVPYINSMIPFTDQWLIRKQQNNFSLKKGTLVVNRTLTTLSTSSIKEKQFLICFFAKRPVHESRTHFLARRLVLDNRRIGSSSKIATHKDMQVTIKCIASKNLQLDFVTHCKNALCSLLNGLSAKKPLTGEYILHGCSSIWNIHSTDFFLSLFRQFHLGKM